MRGASLPDAVRICTLPRLVGIEVADARGEGVVAVQRLAEGVERERLDVVLEVRMRQVRPAAGEGAELRRRHAHRPAALPGVLQADLRLAPERVGQAVQGLHALDAEDRADLQMVLEVLADAGEVAADGDAVRLQQRRRADAGELQDLRRADRAGGENRPRRRARASPSRRRRRRPARPARRRARPSASSSTLSMCAPVQTCRLGRRSIGRRNALVAFQRMPARWLTSK